MDYLTVLFWALIGSVFSLTGGLLLISNDRLRKAAVRYGMPFGAGALLAAAFLGVLPEAIEGSGIHQALLFSLAGFLTFFFLERLLGWFHHHHKTTDRSDEPDPPDASHQWLVVIGDTLHNAIDGVALGAAFLVDPAAGIGAALAIAAHEIPQEIGDFSILLGKGMKPSKVIIVSVVSAFATVIAALITFAIGNVIDINPTPLLAVAAGFFIYVAASDIVPDIHDTPRREGDIQAVMLLVGVVMIGFVITLTPHSHDETNYTNQHNGQTHL